MSTPRAFEIVNDALKALVTEPAEKVRKLRNRTHRSHAERRVGDRHERHVANDRGRRFLARHDPESPGRRAEADGTAGKLTGLDAPEKVQEVGELADAKATLLAELKKMAERMRPSGIAAPNEET